MLHGRVTRKKKTLGSLLCLSYTSGKWSAPSTRTSWKSRQWHQHPWTPLRLLPSQWPSSPRSKSEDGHQNTLRSTPGKAIRKKQQRRGDKDEATKRNPSQCGIRDRSWQEYRDLFPWRRERRGAYSGSLTIGSSTSKKLHNNLFWPSPLSSKFLIIQVPYHWSPLSSKFLIIQVFYHWSPLSSKSLIDQTMSPLSLYQSRVFLFLFLI